VYESSERDPRLIFSNISSSGMSSPTSLRD
jgi:hypothetical protein